MDLLRFETWFRLVLILLAVFLAGLIAVQTRMMVHPDEFIHMDAFKYYENHWWPPDFGSDEVSYSFMGRNRVYNGEIVYFLYGKLGKIFLLFMGETDANRILIYRLLNVGLLSLTLGALFFRPCRWFNSAAVGFLIVAIPQVIYIYGYANSDGWGLSMSVFLFLVVVTGLDEPFRSWSWRRFILLGGFTGLIFLSKVTFWLSLLLPYGLVVTKLIQEIRQDEDRFLVWLSGRFLAVGLVAVVIATPLKVIYPLTQGDLSLATVMQMWSTNNLDDSTHNISYAPTLNPGETPLEMLLRRSWFEFSLKSFYGVFGYFVAWNPDPIYYTIGLMALSAFIFTIFEAVRYWDKLPRGLKVCLIMAPGIIALNFAASIYNSVYVNFQPQGRYLFPALLPFSFLLMGTMSVQNGGLKITRAIMWGAAYLICLYSLFFVAATNFVLLKPDENIYIKNPFQSVQPLYHYFTDGVELVGVDTEVKGDFLVGRLFWQIKSNAAENVNRPTVYVHLVDAQAQRLTGTDVLFDQEAVKSVIGSIFVSNYKIPLAEDIPTGTYDLVIGLYYFDQDQPVNLGSAITFKEGVTIKR